MEHTGATLHPARCDAAKSVLKIYYAKPDALMLLLLVYTIAKKSVRMITHVMFFTCNG